VNNVLENIESSPSIINAAYGFEDISIKEASKNPDLLQIETTIQRKYPEIISG